MIDLIKTIPYQRYIGGSFKNKLLVYFFPFYFFKLNQRLSYELKSRNTNCTFQNHQRFGYFTSPQDFRQSSAE